MACGRCSVGAAMIAQRVTARSRSRRDGLRNAQRWLCACTASTSTWTCAGSMSGDMPWPRLNTWPSREAVAGGIGVEHACGGRGDRIRRGVQRGRVEVALQGDAATGAAVPRPGPASSPGPAHRHRCATALQVQAGAFAEQDQRRALAAFAALQLLGDALQVAQQNAPVHRRRQYATGVEHLQRLHRPRCARGERSRRRW